MLYKEFDKKYNKRNYAGVVLECSIIDFDGNIIYSGKIDDVDIFFDDNVDFVWRNGKLFREYNGKEVTMTNLANYSWYRDPTLDKLNFEVR